MFTATSVLQQLHIFNRHNPVRSHHVILKALFCHWSAYHKADNIIAAYWLMMQTTLQSKTRWSKFSLSLSVSVYVRNIFISCACGSYKLIGWHTECTNLTGVFHAWFSGSLLCVTSTIHDILYFSVDNTHLKYNAHPRLFQDSFWCIDNVHDAN
jgi:hypothetical protein